MVTKQEYFDMSAEDSIASLMGEPLTPAERTAIYDENIADGLIPVIQASKPTPQKIRELNEEVKRTIYGE